MAGKAGNSPYATRMNPEYVASSKLDGEIDEAIDWIEEIRVEAANRRESVSSSLKAIHSRKHDHDTIVKMRAEVATLMDVETRAHTALERLRER